MSAWFMVGWALVGMAVLFALVHQLARRMDNYGIVDIAWSYAFAGLAIFYAAVGGGWATRRWLLAALVSLWSLRLGTHLYRRVMGHHPVEDGRYVELRRRWAGNLAGKMFRFFQLQAVSVILLGMPFLLMMQNQRPHFSAWELGGALLWLIGIGGEALADAQLAAFKRRNTDRRLVCRAGLWRYSRHPNYFFEWLVWCAYFVMACGSPAGWISVFAPLTMLYLLLRVTGIPLTEEQAVRSRGDAYRHYQATTRAFVPRLPKTGPDTEIQKGNHHD